MVEQRRQAREALVADQLLGVEAAALLPEGDVALPRHAPQLVVDGHRVLVSGRAFILSRASGRPGFGLAHRVRSRALGAGRAPCGGPLSGSQRWVALALAVPLVGAGGQAPQAPPPVVRVTLSLVQVDAVVTDKAGRHVTDLSAADFEIFEDGRRQEITHCSYVAMPGRLSRRPPPAAADPALPPPPAATRLRPERVRRTIALVVDDLGLSFRSTVEVREALKKFVDEQMEPGDLVAIIRTRGGIGALQQFTYGQGVAPRRDRARAVQRRREPDGRRLVRGGRRGQEPVDPTPVREGPEARAASGIDDLRESMLARPASQHHCVIGGLRELPGRKAVDALLRRLAALQDVDRTAAIVDPGREAAARSSRGASRATRSSERGRPEDREVRSGSWSTTPTGPPWCSTRSTRGAVDARVRRRGRCEHRARQFGVGTVADLKATPTRGGELNSTTRRACR